MLCVLCGRRAATSLLISAQGTDAPTPRFEHDIPVEYVELPRIPFNVCDDCMSASMSRALHERIETVIAEEEAARAARVRALPNEPPSPAVVPLTEDVMRASTDAEVDLRRLRDALAALAAFLASPAGRTHPNCTTVGASLDSPDVWRRVNRNRTRWLLLPAAYRDVLFNFAAVAATFSDPSMADGLEATPEQLVAAIAALQLGTAR